MMGISERWLHLIVFLAMRCHISFTAPITTFNDENAKVYLKRFNYIRDFPYGDTLEYVDGHVFSEALLQFQEMADIPMTGKLDNMTKIMMMKTRCVLADIPPYEGYLPRKERYSTHYGGVWQKDVLTYKITGLHPNVSVKAFDEIRRAFDAWQAVIPLTFLRKDAGSSDMTFYFYSDENGHLYIHFHDNVYWIINLRCDVRTLWTVLAHVIGHALGLSHSWTPNATMWPFFDPQAPKSELHVDDIVGMQSLYGARPGGPTPQPFLPFQFAEFCTLDQIDAISRSDDNKHYVFSGEHFAELVPEGIAADFSNKIEKRWPGMVGPVDAVLWAPQRHEYVNKRSGYKINPAHTIFFKESYIWKYVDRILQAGYPKNITDDFVDLPSDIDSAFTLKGYRKFFFTKGSSYYRYSENGSLDDGFPRSIVDWQGLPNSFDAAFQYYHSENTFFFKGVDYYLFDHERFEVVRGYPRPISINWFGCQNDISMEDILKTEIGRIPLKELDMSFSGTNITQMFFTTEEPLFIEQPRELTSGQMVIGTPCIVWSISSAFILTSYVNNLNVYLVRSLCRVGNAVTAIY